eukprot:15280002-Alexandrium_andersonii.AAC.1
MYRQGGVQLDNGSVVDGSALGEMLDGAPETPVRPPASIAAGAAAAPQETPPRVDPKTRGQQPTEPSESKLKGKAAAALKAAAAKAVAKAAAKSKAAAKAKAAESGG